MGERESSTCGELDPHSHIFGPFRQTSDIPDITNWNTSVTSSSSMILYKELKPIFERSAYLDIVENKKHRNIIAKLRLSSHKLFLKRVDTRTLSEINENVVYAT